jgi:hypothetical protein
VDEGYRMVGLIDGRFEDVAAVWHKEILYALSRGVAVLGAASMGALRAAECYPFGMIGVGEIFTRYAFGGLEDDAAVAQVHAPAEFGYTAFSEAMVTIDATLDAALAKSAISADEYSLIRGKANAIFFKERTWDRIFGVVSFDIERAAERLKPFFRNVKRDDALEMLNALLEPVPPEKGTTSSPHVTGWLFNETTQWRKLRA